MLTIVLFIAILGFLIFIHELGHFLAARKVGVHVQEFSIGFPPKIVSKTIGKTTYMLSWIPLGGYVRLKGQNIEDENPNEPDNYAAKSIPQRFFILVAGPLMNLLVAFMVMPLFYYIGYEQLKIYYASPVIGEVQKESLLEKLDIRKKDRILLVNNIPVKTWREAYQQISSQLSKEITLVIEREGKKLQRTFQKEAFLNGKIRFEMYGSSFVGDVISGSPAEKANLRPGDKILQVNGENIESWSQISRYINQADGQFVEIVILRNGQEISLLIQPVRDQQTGERWVIGMNQETIRVSHSWEDAVVKGTQEVVYMTAMTFDFLGKLIRGEASTKELGGPIMIASVIGETARQSSSSLLKLVAFISLQLGIFNLLPIPALDGGHIFLLLIEKIKGSGLSPKIREKTQMVGFSLLLLLMVFVTIQDSLKLANWY